MFFGSNAPNMFFDSSTWTCAFVYQAFMAMRPVRYACALSASALSSVCACPQGLRESKNMFGAFESKSMLREFEHLLCSFPAHVYVYTKI